LTDQLPAKKKRRRRNRRRGSGGGAGPAVLTAADVANYQRPGVVLPPLPVKVTITPEDAEIQAEEQAHIKRMQTADELAAALVPLIMQARHKEVFDWLCAAYGVSPAALITQIVRAEIARQTPNYREAKGAGGKSSRNLDTLLQRI